MLNLKQGGANTITHVGVFSGRGNMIHASSYFKYEKVVESKTRYVTSYSCASRLRPR